MTTSKNLPKYIDPLQLAKRGTVLQGTLCLADMARLHDYLYDTNAVITVMLEFGRDEERFYYIKGMVQGVLPFACQRCLQRMEVVVNTAVSLSPVTTDDAAKKLPSRYDPLMIHAEEPILLIDMAEEELLLKMPAVVMHPSDVCPQHLETG